VSKVHCEKSDLIIPKIKPQTAKSYPHSFHVRESHPQSHELFLLNFYQQAVFSTGCQWYRREGGYPFPLHPQAEPCTRPSNKSQ